MILPVTTAGGAPFTIDTPDPRSTFVVYYSGFGERRMLGAREIKRKRNGEKVSVICGYTDTHYFEVEAGEITKFDEHILGCVPIFEYRV